MLAAVSLCLAAWGTSVAAAGLAPRQTQAPTTTAAAAAKPTAITSCHLHGSDLYCMAGTTEYHVEVTVTATSEVPAQYTDCHSHGTEMYCVDSAGEDVSVHAEGSETEEEHDHEHEESEEGHDEHEDEHSADSAGESKHCHFHAGVEHCVDSEESEPEGIVCEAPNRDYNIGLRVGLLFVILATSAIGVFGPILLHKVMPTKLNTFFIVLKQFGTGIIISTAFVHLYTHAALMFGNKCLGELEYEATTSAILMAGIFMSFVVEYAGHRVVNSRIKAAAALSQAQKTKAVLSNEVVSILVMEAGIVFHSLLIGLTLVVAADEFFITLFVVILFHQMFEGMALGSRIATIGTRAEQEVVRSERSSQDSPSDANDKSINTSTAQPTSSEEDLSVPIGFPMKKKLGLAALFALITPIGMAIGIGVLQHFNGNDKSTIIAIGTLDALSAGILVWVGLVEMWAADWMVGSHGHKAELADAPILTVLLAGFGLVAGLMLMSLLGKWA